MLMYHWDEYGSEINWIRRENYHLIYKDCKGWIAWKWRNLKDVISTGNVESNGELEVIGRGELEDG
jgi:hypothetical protein